MMSVRIYRRTLALIAATALVASVAPGALTSSAVEPPPTFLGMATLDMSPTYTEFASQTGEFPAMHQVFWKLQEPWSQAVFDSHADFLASNGIAFYAEIQTDDLEALTSGAQDGALDALVSQVAAGLASRPTLRVLVAPLPEMNLPDHPWGQQPVEFKVAYEKIYDAFRDAGLGPDKIRFVFSVNGEGSVGYDYSLFYPGDDLVDILGFSKLNRNTPWEDYQGAIQDFIDEMQVEVTRVKPILLTQTGSVTETGDRDQWLRDMFRNLQEDPQVIGAIYFNRDKFEGGKQNNYLIATETWVDPVVIAEYTNWSRPSEFEWVFDGRMDDWITARAEEIVFDDIGSSIFAEDILWMAEQGISLGCAPYKYCPDDPVSRGQMASFMKRALGLPDSSKNWFTDDDGSTHEASINSVADAGITLGCGGSLYCPGDLVTRGQMASFLARSLDLPISSVNWFVDDDGDPHEPNINRVADDGITLGCGTNLYCPDDFVTRGQMAAFLRRALDD